MGRTERARQRYDKIVKGQAKYSDKNADRLRRADDARDHDAMRHGNGKITLRFEASPRAVRRGERAAKRIEKQVDRDGKKSARANRKNK